MTNFIVTENTPGYLPESEPASFETFEEALDYAHFLKNEIMDQYLDADSEAGGITGLYSIHETKNDHTAEIRITCNDPGRLDRVIEVNPEEPVITNLDLEEDSSLD